MAQAIIGQNPFYKGATALEISRLLDMPVATVRDNLARVHPVGKRGNVDLYHVGEAAKALMPTNMEEDSLREILKQNFSAMPQTFAKEFWAGMTLRQKFLLTDGELWPTEKVVEYLGETLKQIRLAMMLMSDTVERQEGLTEKQRSIIIASVDATLNDAADRLVNAFSGREASSHEAESSEEDDGSQEL